MRLKFTGRFLITTGTLIICSVLWLQGLLNSQITNPERTAQRALVNRSVQENSADFQAEKVLAEAYWLRYPDIREDSSYGKNGSMGIFGPRAHYEQHGKGEQRIFAPIEIPDDLVREQELAEAYWNRYPEVEKSNIWGRKSALGILGPRDHYIFIGKPAGLKWGTGRGKKDQAP